MPETIPLTGPGWDFAILWQVGRAVLSGMSPYTVVGSYYPPGTAYLFVGFALLPQTVAYAIWIILSIAMIIAIVSPRRTHLWMIYMPVLFVLAAGQLDLAFLFLAMRIDKSLPATWHAPLFASAITLKPQMAFVLLPWLLIRWIRAAIKGDDRRSITVFAAATLVLHLYPLLIDSSIYQQWYLKVSSLVATAAQETAGVFSLVSLGIPYALLALIAIVIAVVSWLQSDEPTARAGGLFALPFGEVYGAVVLIDVAPWWLLAPVSWLALILAHAANAFYPIGLISLVAVVWSYRHRLSRVRL